MGLMGLLLYRVILDHRLPKARKAKGNCKRWDDTPSTHGKYMVSVMIERLIDHDGGYLFDNVILPDGRSIDHIYVSRRGIFFINTINEPGSYYGTDDNNEWVRLTPNKEKQIIPSPSLSNQDFIDAFSWLLSPIHDQRNVVFFTNADIKNVMSKHAMPAMSFPNVCLRLPIVLSEAEIYEYASKIITYTK